MKENLSKNKVWQIVGVAVLCAVCVLTAVLGVVFGMNHSSEDLNVSKDMSDNDIVVNATEENGIMLTSGVATTAADGTTSKTLTATVTPTSSSSLSYSWSVAFKNASSAWATGKNVTDYVTVAQDSSNKFKATVTFKKRFSEQIIVTVACIVKPSIKATATVDCYKEVTGFNFNAVNKSDSSNIVTYDGKSSGAKGYFTDSTYNVNYSFTYGDGTVMPTVKFQFQAGSSWIDFVDSGSELDLVYFEQDYDRWNSENAIHARVLVNGRSWLEFDYDFYLTPSSLALDNTAIIF